MTVKFPIYDPAVLQPFMVDVGQAVLKHFGFAPEVLAFTVVSPGGQGQTFFGGSSLLTREQCEHVLEQALEFHKHATASGGSMKYEEKLQ